MNLSPEQKIAGVLAPLFALRTETDLGIGDLGALRQFIDWAAGIGFKIVQLLPINEMGGDHSPYNAISAVALESTTLYLAPGSPEDLSQEDFDEVIAHNDLARLRQGSVKHHRVRRLKLSLLEKSFARFSRRSGGRVAGRLRVLPRAHGREWKQREMGPMARGTSHDGFGARLACRAIFRGAGAIR